MPTQLQSLYCGVRLHGITILRRGNMGSSSEAEGRTPPPLLPPARCLSAKERRSSSKSSLSMAGPLPLGAESSGKDILSEWLLAASAVGGAVSRKRADRPQTS